VADVTNGRARIFVEGVKIFFFNFFNFFYFLGITKIIIEQQLIKNVKNEINK